MSHRRPASPLTRSLKRLQTAFWQRRAAHWLVRAAWLALLVPTIYMAGYLWLGWPARWYYWLGPMLLVGLLALLWSLRPLPLKRMVHHLDRRLGLRARLVTAFEVSSLKAAKQAENPVVERLFLETVNTTINLRQRVRPFDRGFWLEMQTLMAVVALLSALLMLDALQPNFPSATPVELPAAWQEPKADEVIPPDPQLLPPPFAPQMQVQQQLDQAGLQQALESLADALRDPAATHAIAEALDRGDLSGAAEGLRRLADRLGQLSEQARAELGQSLREAAQAMGTAAPGLTEPAQAGSNALDADNLEAARQALEDLAEVLESLGEVPPETAQIPPESGNQPGENSPAQSDQSEENQQPPPDQAGDSSGAGAGAGEGEAEGGNQPTEEERLAVEGEPLELTGEAEAEGQVLQPAPLDAQAGDELTEDSPFARRPVNISNGDLGPDPLSYPWQKRDVIRRYFTP